MSYRLLICPKCTGPFEEDSEYGDSCASVTCGFAGDPVEICFEDHDVGPVLTARIRGALDLERFKLRQLEREDEFRKADLDWYRNLDVAGRFWEDSRRKAARDRVIAAMPSKMARFDAVVKDVWTNSFLDTMRDTNRFLFGEWKPRELEEWLADQADVPEVLEWFGFKVKPDPSMASGSIRIEAGSIYK